MSSESRVVRVALTAFWLLAALLFYAPLTICVKLCEGVVLAYRITKEVCEQIWAQKHPIKPRGGQD